MLLYFLLHKHWHIIKLKITYYKLIFFADSRGLEVCCYGDRSSPTLHLLHRNNGWDCGHLDGCPTHLRVRGSRQNHRNIQGKVITSNYASFSTRTFYQPERFLQNHRTSTLISFEFDWSSLQYVWIWVICLEIVMPSAKTVFLTLLKQASV